MKILLLSTYFRPDIASTGVIMSKLVDEFVARGHEVTVLASVPHYESNRVWPEYSRKLIYRESNGPIKILRLYTYVARDKANVTQRILAYGSFHLLSLLQGLALPRHDVIFVPSPPLSNGVVGDFIARFRNTPMVYNVQDIWPDVAIRAGVLTNAKTIARLRRMEQYVYRRASGIAVLSEGFRKNLLAKGVPYEKISVISNFMDIDHITPQPKDNSFAQSHGIRDKFVVLFAGNMGFSQGLATVLDAAKLVEHVSDIQFLMVGNGAGRAAAESYCSDLGVQNVRFLPYQAYADVPAMYGAADVCLIPLKKGFTAESVPCKLFSIMAAARPAIASVDESSETAILLSRSGGGLIVPPESGRGLADAILHYYRNPQERASAGVNGRRCVTADFVPRVIADKYLRLFQDVMGRESAVGRHAQVASRDIHSN